MPAASNKRNSNKQTTKSPQKPVKSPQKPVKSADVNLSRNELQELSKEQLVELALLQQDRLDSLSAEVQKIKQDIDILMNNNNNNNNEFQLGDFNSRIIDLERATFEQQQYSGRECLEIVGISNDIPNEEVENQVIKILEEINVNVTPKDFHAVHRLGDKKKQSLPSWLTAKMQPKY